MFRGSSPPQLPTLVVGQRIPWGPHVVTVTEEMVREREQLNADLALRWHQQSGPTSPQSDYLDEFQEAKVRRRFVSRVFILVSLQLAITASIVAACLFVEDLGKLVRNHQLRLLALLGFGVSFFGIQFSSSARRGVLGVACLLVLTVCVSLMAASASLEYSSWTVLFAASFAAIITLAVSLLAACTNFDITKYWGFTGFIALVLGLVMLFLLHLLLPDNHLVELLIATLGALTFSLMLLYETQTIMGGRAIAVQPHEVIYATANLYVQIVFIYRTLLMCRCW